MRKRKNDTSSSHLEEDHSCISFDEPQKDTSKMSGSRRARSNAGQQGRKASAKKPATVIAIVVAVVAMLSVLSSVFSLVGSVFESEAEPEYNYGAYVLAGAEGAQDVPSIDPVEIYNADNIVITVDSAGMYYDDYTFAVTIRNGTGQNITVSSDLLSVNGYMSFSSGLFTDVPAGETRQSFLQFYSYDLEDAGIEQVAQVQFYLDIYDSDEYTDIARTGLICLETQIAGSYVQPVDDSGWELYNQEGVRIILKNAELSSYGDFTMTLFVENETDQKVCLSDEGIYINEKEASGSLWSNLLPHTRAIESIYCYDMDEIGIESLSQLQQVRIEALVECMDGWQVLDSRSQSIVLDPNQLG